MRVPVSKLRLPRMQTGHIIAGLTVLLLIGVLAAGCIGDTDTPQNTLAPEGEVAETQRDLFMWAMWPALVVMILVLGVIVVMLLRFRRREGDPIPKQTHGNMPLEIGWTIIPTLVIMGFVGVPMLFFGIFDIGREPSADAYPITVTGQRFDWVFTYPEILDDRSGEPVFTIRELYIPAGKEIALTLTSIDVNHSFGVPRLAGTRDAFPGEGHEEVMWIIADEPGSYAGQCRELCGTGHATMLITVIAMSEEDFEDWSEEMAAGVKTSPDSGPTDAVSATGSGE